MRLTGRKTAKEKQTAAVAKAKARAAAKPRRKPAPRWVRPALRGAAVFAAAAIVVGGPFWLWKSGLAEQGAGAVRAAAVKATADMGLTVQTVLLEGRRNAPRGAVTRAVGLKRGDAMLGFDPAAIRGRLLALPWVRDASVERRLPGTVNIRIKERRPLALLQRDRRLALIDEAGEEISGANLGKFRSLMIVVGKDAAQHAPTLIAMLGSEPALANKVSAAVRIGKRRWNVRLNGGVEVKLPETDAHAAWRRLARLEARHRLLARDIRNIDMRLPDRLIVRTGEDGTVAKPAKGKKT
jgi:cell division protein FtsQ